MFKCPSISYVLFKKKSFNLNKPGNEVEIGATPKRATSIPKDLATGGIPTPKSKESSPAPGLQRPASKESLNQVCAHINSCILFHSVSL